MILPRRNREALDRTADPELGNTFLLKSVKPTRKERKAIFRKLVAAPTPYGDIEVHTAIHPPRTTVLSAILPPAELTYLGHVRDPENGIPADEKTRLTIGDQVAVVSRNKWATKTMDRAINIRLGARDYRYLRAQGGAEDLHERDRGLLVRYPKSDGKNITVSVFPAADPTDVALALVLRGIDRTGLTLASAAVFGILRFLFPGDGKA